MTEPPGTRQEVDRTASTRRAREHALVLDAIGIDYTSGRDGRQLLLLVRPHDAPRALIQIQRFDMENRGWPPGHHPLPRLSSGVAPALAYGATLLFFHLAQHDWWTHIPWTAAGRGDSGLLLGGAWWRAVTELCLHTGVIHLSGNLVFGAPLVAAVCQLAGSGVGLLAILLAGALGNWLNACLHGPGHLSLGASTAVFGALAILVGFQSWRRATGRSRRWLPFAAGLAFLAFLGMAGEHTDVLAHISGFGSGLLFGLLLSTPISRRITRIDAVQPLAMLAAMGLLLLAWILALR